MLKTVVFDFDGTIADTIPLIMKCLRDLDEEQRYHHIQLTEELREKSILDIALHELRLPILLLRRLKRRVEEHLATHWRGILVFPGIKEQITMLRKQYRVGILTTNRADIVAKVLRKEDIVVDFIDAGSSLFGKGRRLRRLQKEQHLRPEEMLYIGDEIRDDEACRRAGTPIISVTWGLNSRAGHERHEPFRIVDAPEEIRETVRAYAHSTSTDSTRPSRPASG